VSRPPTRNQKEQRRVEKAAAKQRKQQQKQQQKQPKASKAPQSIWDVNENEVDSDDDDEWRKKSVMQAAVKRKSFVNYDAPMGPPKRGARQQFDEARRKSVFEETSSEEDSSDEEAAGNGRRLTVNMTRIGQNHSVSGHVNLAQ